MARACHQIPNGKETPQRIYQHHKLTSDTRTESRLHAGFERAQHHEDMHAQVECKVARKRGVRD